jgi:hypothetical protein
MVLGGMKMKKMFLITILVMVSMSVYAQSNDKIRDEFLQNGAGESREIWISIVNGVAQDIAHQIALIKENPTRGGWISSMVNRYRVILSIGVDLGYIDTKTRDEYLRNMNNKVAEVLGTADVPVMR